MTKNKSSKPASYVGAPVQRLEDKKFLTGRGRYVDDIVLPRQLYAHFVRCPHAHAEIKKIKTSRAEKAPGVVAVVTGEDIDDLGDVPPNWVMPGSIVKGRPPLAREIVRHSGEGVAVVIAEAAPQAADAAELIDVQYSKLVPLTDAKAALEEGAPLIHADLKDNVATVFRTGNGGYDTALEAADREISFSLRNQRLIPFPIEPRAINAEFDAATDRMTVYVSQQIPHTFRRMLAKALPFPEQKLRIVSPDVGGGFGPKMHFYPEYLLLCHLTQKLSRPIKWTETRSENAVATTHGRDHKMDIRIAVQENGKILGLKVDSAANIGAYLSSMGTGIPTANVALFAIGVYQIPYAEINVKCAYTNTTPVDAYRGAGRPEAAYLIERVVERVAMELKLDPAEVRLTNFIPAQELPFSQVTGNTIDTAQHVTTLKLAAEKLGYQKLRRAQAKGRQDGRLIGIGFSNYTESCGVGPAELLEFIGFDRGGFESALVRVHADGRAVVLSGSHSHGQGHVTTYAQIAADELGIPIEHVEVLQGDTDLVPHGVGTFNSRSVPIGGNAVKLAAERVSKKMKKIAGHMLGVDPAEVTLEDGIFRAASSNETASIDKICRAAWTGQGMPREFGIGLEETEFFHPTAMAAPYGAHIAAVEVDVETGEVSLEKYVAIDDCGVVINPLLARGQVHGGLAQGIGQALYEDAGIGDDGVPVADPPIPRFDMVPRFDTGHTVSPAETNPLGAKGLGEAGAIGAPPAIVNAAIDALWHLGVRELDMPLTPERVLTAIEKAQSQSKSGAA